MTNYDLVIIGGGIAGLTAGTTAGRCGLSVAVIDKLAPGGQILNVPVIENFPGFPQGIAGYDLGPILMEQAEQAGATFLFDTVEAFEDAGDTKTIRCAGDEIVGKAAIIATGSSLRQLGIPGEDSLTGKGVSHCASCDGPLFSGQEVCVVGGGDAALDEASVLADFADKVTVYHRGDTLRAQKAVLDKTRGKANVEIVLGTQVAEIVGSGTVTGVRLRDTGTETEHEKDVAGVFIFVGLDPNTAFLQGILDLDPSGHVVTDILMRTSREGVFAAGDVRQGSVAQLATVAGDGATAAVAAWRYLLGRP